MTLAIGKRFQGGVIIYILDSILSVEQYKIWKYENKSDVWIAKKLKVGGATLYGWKKRNELLITVRLKGNNLLDTILSIDKYKEWKIQGESDTRIAKELEVSVDTLQRWKIKNGITITPINSDPLHVLHSNLSVKQYKKWKEEYKKDIWIAKELKVSLKDLTKWKKKNGIQNTISPKGNNLLDSILTVETYIKRKIQHESDEQIAKELHVSFHTLERWKLKHGITKTLVNKTRYGMIQSWRNEGFKTDVIAHLLGITGRMVAYIEANPLYKKIS